MLQERIPVVSFLQLNFHPTIGRLHLRPRTCARASQRGLPLARPELLRCSESQRNTSCLGEGNEANPRYRNFSDRSTFEDRLISDEIQLSWRDSIGNIRRTSL